MKLTTRDRLILMIVALSLVCYGGYHLLWLPGTVKTTELENRKAELEGLAVDVTPLLKQTKTLETEENELIKKVNVLRTNEKSVTLTKEDFLILLGNSSGENNVKLLRFHDLGTANEEGVWTATFDFELQGTAYAINSLLSDIENIGIKYSAGSLSYRQNAEYPYLKRFFDSYTNLPWYSEPQPTKEPLPEETPTDEYLPPYAEFPVPQEPPKAEPEPIPSPAFPDGDVPEENEETITDRLNKLLEMTSHNGRYEIPLLNRTEGLESFNVGSEMRLAVTLRFIMPNEPNLNNSFRREGV